MWWTHVFLTSALVWGEWSASRCILFTPGERSPSAHCIGGWVGPRAGMDAMENRAFLTLKGIELRPLGRPARSQSLYRPRYRGSQIDTRVLTLYQYDWCIDVWALHQRLSDDSSQDICLLEVAWQKGKGNPAPWADRFEFGMLCQWAFDNSRSYLWFLAGTASWTRHARCTSGTS
jgi:hypothetical protein